MQKNLHRWLTMALWYSCLICKWTRWKLWSFIVHGIIKEFNKNLKRLTAFVIAWYWRCDLQNKYYSSVVSVISHYWLQVKLECTYLSDSLGKYYPSVWKYLPISVRWMDIVSSIVDLVVNYRVYQIPAVMYTGHKSR